EGGGGGPGSQVASGSGSSEVTAPPEHGSGSQVAIKDPGSGATQPVGSGSDARATPVKSGSDGGSSGSSGSETQTPGVKPIEVAVFTSPYVDEFEIWEDGKKVQNGTEDLAIVPGTPRKIVIKAKGFKDSKVITVDG